jgi:PhzF family phenazine biosynthesis protein
MTHPLSVIDAFTDHPFAGNPAAVCLLPSWPGDAWMQNVAREMNLSETAFLVRAAEEFQLRWFTPTVEVELCGHATLASAHFLWETGRTREAEIQFHTKSGLLRALRQGDRIELDFPLKPAKPVDPPGGLAEALGVVPVFVGRSKFDYLVLVETATEVRKVAPDFRQLAKLPVRGVIVTSRADDQRFDFISRFFAPASGVDEDPVTGSAHCTLAAFWSQRLGRTEMTGYQASPRGGVVHVRVARERVFLGGQAVTVSRGELVVS